MTIWEFQKQYPEPKDGEIAISKMSKSEIKEIIDSCGTPQGKNAIKKHWESLTGQSY